MMRIGCLMVTENRAPIAGIGIASFVCQRTEPGLSAILLVQDNGGSDPIGYSDVIRRLRPRSERESGKKLVYLSTELTSGPATVPERTDIGCARLFRDYACDLVVIMDDDDYSPPDRLAQTAKLFQIDTPPAVVGYTAGWVVNLRTWRGEKLTVQGLWGGSLAFPFMSWRARPFQGLPAPGYDREFVRHLWDSTPVSGHKGVSCLPQDFANCPIAFSHGKNVATWPMTAGEDARSLIEALPDAVHEEVRRGQQLMIERRVFPPQPV